MGKIFKRRNRRPLVVHKGSVRRTPNFYPQFYGEGGEMAVQVINGLEGLDGAGVRAANSFGDGGWTFEGPDDTKKPMTVRTSFSKNPDNDKFTTAEVSGADIANSAMAALQGAGELTKGASSLADIADTSSIEDAIDEENAKNFDEATDTESLLASYGNTGRLRTDYTFGDVRGMSKSEKTLGILGNGMSGMMSGAQAGSIAGQFGLAIGAGTGLFTGIGSGIIGSAIGDAKARRQAEHLNAQAEAANRYALNAFDSANQSLSDKNWRSNLVNLSAYGGQIEQSGNGTTFLYDYPATTEYAHGGGIHINPKNRGKFTEAASRAGMGVQQFARHVLANRGNYDATTVRRANFARNASKWKHAYGGRIYDGEDDTRHLPEIAEPLPAVESLNVATKPISFIDPVAQRNGLSGYVESVIADDEPYAASEQLTPDLIEQYSSVPDLDGASIVYEYPNETQRRLANYRATSRWDMDYIPNGIEKGYVSAYNLIGGNAKRLSPLLRMVPEVGWALGPMSYAIGEMYELEQSKSDPEIKDFLKETLPYSAGYALGLLKVPYASILGTIGEEVVGDLMDQLSEQ